MSSSRETEKQKRERAFTLGKAAAMQAVAEQLRWLISDMRAMLAGESPIEVPPTVQRVADLMRDAELEAFNDSGGEVAVRSPDLQLRALVAVLHGWAAEAQRDSDAWWSAWLAAEPKRGRPAKKPEPPPVQQPPVQQPSFNVLMQVLLDAEQGERSATAKSKGGRPRALDNLDRPLLDAWALALAAEAHGGGRAVRTQVAEQVVRRYLQERGRRTTGRDFEAHVAREARRLGALAAGLPKPPKKAR